MVDMLPRPAESLGFPTTCTMLVNPIDVVRLPRNAKPVAFLAHPRQPFQPARWLAPPNLAWLDRASEDERLFFLRAWARDPRTPPGVAVVMTYLPAEQIWKVAGDLLQRSDVRRDPRPVTALALLPSGHGTAARALLFDQHATARFCCGSFARPARSAASAPTRAAYTCESFRLGRAGLIRAGAGRTGGHT